MSVDTSNPPSVMPLDLAHGGWRLCRDGEHWRAGNARLELATKRCATPTAAVTAARRKQEWFEARQRRRALPRRRRAAREDT